MQLTGHSTYFFLSVTMQINVILFNNIHTCVLHVHVYTIFDNTYGHIMVVSLQ